MTDREYFDALLLKYFWGCFLFTQQGICFFSIKSVSYFDCFHLAIGAQLAAMKQQAPAAQSAPPTVMLQPPGPSVKPNQFYPEGIVVGGEKTLDMMIPGTKVGYVIGKGGEMIRTLQV